jgi:hypothetical protein
VGQHVRFVGESRWRTVVGVVADVRAYALTRDEPEWIDGTLYAPHAADTTLEDGRLPAEMIAVLDTRLAPTALADHLQRLAQQTGGVVDDGAARRGAGRGYRRSRGDHVGAGRDLSP